MARKQSEDAVLIIGLGRFGSALADGLVRLGHDVLGVDGDYNRVQEWSGVLTHVVQADSTNEAAMRQIGAQDFHTAVVAIGNDIEASVLSTSVLVDLGVPEVWGKAITAPHGRILERVGAGHVVYPERDAGARVAHLLTGRLIDYIEFDDGFAIVKMRPPQLLHDRTLGEVGLRSKYGITIVGVKRPGHDFTYAKPDTRVTARDTIIVSGATELVEKFAAEG